MSDALRFGKYAIVQKIGAGGMAEVFLCRLSGLGGFEKLAVLKRILPQHAGDPEFVGLFLDEARVVANLNHANIVQLYEAGEVEGSPYVSTEYVRGPTLAVLLEQAQRKGRLHIGHAAKIISGVCAGLYYAHHAMDATGEPLKLIHRDVTPANIVISEEGVPKLLDFGAAKARAKLGLTDAGLIRGKLRFMAPEVLGGAAVDRRVDIFAAAACLYEATTGQPVFSAGSDAELVGVVMRGEIAPPSRLVRGFPADLESILMWALAADPAKRCPSALELREALEEFVRGGKYQSSTSAVARWIAELFPEMSGGKATGTELYVAGAGPEAPGKEETPIRPPPPPPEALAEAEEEEPEELVESAPAGGAPARPPQADGKVAAEAEGGAPAAGAVPAAPAPQPAPANVKVTGNGAGPHAAAHDTAPASAVAPPGAVRPAAAHETAPASAKVAGTEAGPHAAAHDAVPASVRVAPAVAVSHGAAQEAAPASVKVATPIEAAPDIPAPVNVSVAAAPVGPPASSAHGTGVLNAERRPASSPTSPAERRRALLVQVVIIGVALAAGALAARLPWPGTDSAKAPAPPAPAPLAAIVPPLSEADLRLKGYLDGAEQLIREKRFGAARDVLNQAREVKAADAALALRLARVSDENDRAGAIHEARVALRSNEPRAALEAATRAALRSPGDRDAERLVETARAQLLAMGEPLPAAVAKLETPPKEASEPVKAAEKAAAKTEPSPGEPEKPAKAEAVPSQLAKVVAKAEPVPSEPAKVRAKVAAKADRKRAPGYALLPRKEKSDRAVAKAEPIRAAEVKVDSPEPKSPEPVKAEPTESPPPPVLSAIAQPTIAPGRPAPLPKDPRTKLPKSYRVKSPEELARVCLNIEGEAVSAAEISNEVASGVTSELQRELASLFGQYKAVEFYPQGIYLLLVNEASQGRDRATIAGKIKDAHSKGTFRSWAGR